MSDFARERKREQMRAMEAMLPEVRRQLEHLPNVDHVLVGAKEVNGVATDQPAFQVYVRIKVGERALGPSEKIPETIAGFPTDVILIEESTLIQEDTDEYRPLCGGSQLNGNGTLGVIALATAGSLAPVDAPVIVTNNHVAPNIGSLLGQPGTACDCWCCECCDVAKVVDTRVNPAVDVSIATLSAGMRFCHEILERGVIRGWAPVTSLSPGDPVFKRGRTTRLTEGRFSNATASLSPQGSSTSFTNQIRITAAVAGNAFALGGDSGSVVVDAQNRVVGLLFASTVPPGSPSFANRIADVRSTMNIDFPVIGTAGAIPLSAGEISAETNDIKNLWLPLRNKAMASEAGRRWAAIIAAHRTEVGQLVRHNRPTTTAWNRYHGPSFVSHYMKTVRDELHRVPDDIGGVRLENLLLAMAAVFQDQGSPNLSHAVWIHYLRIIEISKGCRTVDAFIDRMIEFPPVEINEEMSVR